MTDTSANNKRIAKNTMLLYVRQIFTLCLALYTSRLTLQVLGASDFGIYAAVGGFTALLSILTNSMSSSTQRFITFELGRGNQEKLKTVFNASVQIHVILAIILLLLAETVGVWFLYNHLTIPVERIQTAFWVFQVSILGCIFSILNVPNNASIIAHEDMGTFALFSIIDAILKLLSVLMLFVITWDKLIIYAICLLSIQIINQTIAFIFCRIKYSEVRFQSSFNFPIIRQMFELAGWNIVSNMATMGFIQGTNLLLNIFFGPIMNAAYTIAMQAYSGIRSFCSSFQLAANPQIVKLYSSGDIEKMHNLLMMVCKMSFFLIFFLSLPFIINAKFILSLWLVEVPEHSVAFFILLLIYAYIDVLVYPMGIAAQATGNVKQYNLLTSIATLAILPISYVGYLFGLIAESIYIIAITMSVISIPLRLYCLKRLINFNSRKFIKQVFIKILYVSIVAVSIPLLLHYLLKENLWTVLLNSIVALSSASLSIYCIGLSYSERIQVNKGIQKMISKFHKKRTTYL